MPAKDILELIAYAQRPHSNVHASVSSRAGGLKFCLNLHLLLFFMYASSEGSDETVRMRRLV